MSEKKDGKPRNERPRQQNPEFEKMKAEQAPFLEQMRKNRQQMEKLWERSNQLRVLKGDMHITVNKETREKMGQLKEKINNLKNTINENQRHIDELVKQQSGQHKKYRNIRSVAQCEAEIERLTYDIEHEQLTAEEERSLKEERSQLCKFKLRLPELEKAQAEIDRKRAENSQLKQQLNPLLDEKQRLLMEQRSEIEKISVAHGDIADIDEKIEEIKREVGRLREENDGLKKRSDEVYQQFVQAEKARKEQLEQQRKERERMRAARDAMQPVLKELDGLRVRYLETPRFSGQFTIEPVAKGTDEKAEARVQLIQYLQATIESGVATAADTKQPSELSKEEQKRLRQARNRRVKTVDIRGPMLLAEFGLSTEDADTEEKMRLLIERLATVADDDVEKAYQEKKAKVDAVVQKLKDLGAVVEEGPIIRRGGDDAPRE